MGLYISEVSAPDPELRKRLHSIAHKLATLLVEEANDDPMLEPVSLLRLGVATVDMVTRMLERRGVASIEEIRKSTLATMMDGWDIDLMQLAIELAQAEREEVDL